MKNLEVFLALSCDGDGDGDGDRGTDTLHRPTEPATEPATSMDGWMFGVWQRKKKRFHLRAVGRWADDRLTD